MSRNPLAVIGGAAAIGGLVLLAGGNAGQLDPLNTVLVTLAGAAAGGVLGLLNVLLTRE